MCVNIMKPKRFTTINKVLCRYVYISKLLYEQHKKTYLIVQLKIILFLLIKHQTAYL